MRTLSATLLAVSLAAMAAHADRPGQPPASSDAAPLHELKQLYDARDFFTMSERLQTLDDTSSPGLRFYTAVVQNAFNQPGASNDTLRDLLATADLDPTLRRDALNVRRRNDVRLGDYRAVVADAKQILAMPGHPVPDDTQDIRNELTLFDALDDVPPQRAVMRDDTTIALQPDKAGGRCVPVTIGDATRCYILDSGANFSVLMRSEAEALGLTIVKAGFQVGTSTDVKVTADLTVAPHLTIGSIEYDHVVFLVFPDRLLSFPGGVRIPGILGFPVLEAMGEVRYVGDHGLEIPKTPPPRPPHSLALDQLHLLTPIAYGGRTLACRVDTGADRTVFYEPFFRAFGAMVRKLGTPHTTRTGGVGGIREIPGFRLPSLRITLAGRPVVLDPLDVYTQSITEPRDNTAYCNLGRNTLAKFDFYAFNFRSMSLVLGQQGG